MKITPIKYTYTPNNHIKKNQQKTQTNIEYSNQPCFKSRFDYTTICKISNNLKSFLRRYNNAPLNKFTSNELMTIMSLDKVVLPTMFFALYDKSPLITKTLLNHERSAELNDSILEKMLDADYSEGVSEEQAEMFEKLLDVKYEGIFPLFTIPEALENSIQAPTKTTSMIIKHSDKLQNIFSGIKASANGFLDYFACAEAFELSNDLEEDEVKSYYTTFDSAEEKWVVLWSKMDKKDRFEILHLMNESDIIIDACSRSGIELAPDERLLSRLQFLEENRADFYDIFDVAPLPNDLLDGNINTNEGLKKALQTIKSMPSEVKEFCNGNGLLKVFFDFEVITAHKPYLSKVTIDDLKKVVEILSIYNTEEEIDFGIQNINDIPVMSEEMQAILKNNLSGFAKSIAEDVSYYNQKTFVKNLFNDEFEANYNNAQQLINPKIFTQLALKCQNRNPVFTQIAKEFFEKNSNYPIILSDIPNLDEATFIQSLFDISKLQIAALHNLDKGLKKHKKIEEYISLLPKDKLKAMTFERTYIDKDFHSDLMRVKDIYNKFKDPYTFYNLLNLVAVTDAEYANLFLDKGFTSLTETAYNIAHLPYKTKKVMQYLFKHAKTEDSNGEIIKLSGKQKMTIASLISRYYELIEEKMDEIIKDAKIKENFKTKDFVIDYEKFKTSIYKSLIAKASNNEYDLEALNKWDLDYFHLIVKPTFKDDGELALAVELLSKGKLVDYITDKSTPYGANNAITEEKFKENQLDYNLWLNDTKPQTIWINGNEYTIELFDRNNPNNLFMGSYANCCTALDASHGDAAANYILNTVFGIFNIKNSKGNIVATTRIFMAEKDEKPAIVIDSIELSNELSRSLNKNSEEIFANDIFNHIEKFADKISNEKMPIYMSSACAKICLPEHEQKNIMLKPLGSIKKKFLYINSMADVVNTKRDIYASLRIIREV